MINYHYLDVPSHVTHHNNDIECGKDDADCNILNYGPDAIDVVFGSKKEGQEYEDMKYTTINVVFIMILVIFFY